MYLNCPFPVLFFGTMMNFLSVSVVSPDSNASFNKIFAFIDRTGNDVAEILLVIPDIFTAILTNELVITDITL